MVPVRLPLYKPCTRAALLFEAMGHTPTLAEAIAGEGGGEERREKLSKARQEGSGQVQMCSAVQLHKVYSVSFPGNEPFRCYRK